MEQETTALSFPLAAVVCAVLAVTQPACAPEPVAEPEFETVEVGGRATDNLTAEDDAAEAVSTHGLAGRLPSGFPSGLPVPASSSVVRTASRSVTFGTEDSAASILADLKSQLGRAGWTPSGASEQNLTYSNGTRSVSIGLTEEAERTLIQYRY